MEQEKLQPGEIVVKGKFASWFENFWYHYKWVSIGVLFAIFVFCVCMFQTCSREKEDVVVVYAGPRYLQSVEIQQIGAVFDDYLPYDYDENGEKHTIFSRYEILSGAEISDLRAQTDEDGKPLYYVDGNYIGEQYSTYESYLKTGESTVFFLSPWLYEELLQEEMLRPLSDLGLQECKGNMDGYGVRLGDTEFYSSNPAIRFLPEDTVVCQMRQMVIGKNKKDARYQFESDLFEAIVTNQRAQAE